MIGGSGGSGGSGGLGSAMARALLSRGARVGIVDLRPDTLEIAADISSSHVVGFPADVCDRSALNDAVAHLCERFGRVGVAIGSAGISIMGSARGTRPPRRLRHHRLIQTDMIRNGVDADPTITEMPARTSPGPLLKRLAPDQAAGAVVRVIEHRSPRVIRPARWAPLSVPRGVINPVIDGRLARDRVVHAILGKLDGRSGR
ncbi:SDR family NAD(P)-dependent oxidoreductase [Streptomyces europaeiscabiei]|uniref:SDR family NAD(P)-dependent oxidoreductase n=1 Tax=Streptomyces europaeiscabiei TaxID=146819 RepID=A0AAJ2PJJ2_9ACTN|nr:SDR family NAD(P)-dependent oxidoreductase [Streptomyces europaeiscabiei]MDX3128348.1 SDR family NAD(P)-dependent oxidoreductase [Streptomyces europaeiscabiei]